MKYLLLSTLLLVLSTTVQGKEIKDIQDVCLPEDIFEEAIIELRKGMKEEGVKEGLHGSYRAINTLCAKQGHFFIVIEKQKKKVTCRLGDQI